MQHPRHRSRQAHRVADGFARPRCPGAPGQRPHGHFPWGGFRRQVHERRALQQAVLFHFRLHGAPKFAAGIGVDVHFVAQLEEAGDLPEDEGFRDDRKAADKHRDAQPLAHARASRGAT